MTDTYKILFELEVMHTYFTSGLCEGLIYKPSLETQQLMDRYNLKLFMTNKGFQFYATKAQTNEEFLNYLADARGISSFVFYAKTSDSNFYQFTDFPVGKSGVLMFDSNLTESEDGVEVLDQQLMTQQSTSHLFMLTIQLSDLLKYVEEGDAPQYRIQFESRTTAWQYNIINNSRQHVNQLSVKGQYNVEFDGGQEVTLENGQSAIAFTSLTDTIPYSEAPHFTFDLVNTTERLGTSKEKTIFKGLPTPNPSQLRVINKQEQKMVLSPTYVYI